MVIHAVAALRAISRRTLASCRVMRLGGGRDFTDARALACGNRRKPVRMARFEREARLLASLNHPHIAQVYGFQESHSGGSRHVIRALVMDLIDGPDARRPDRARTDFRWTKR
jgi:serine/threonine protein kinase